MPSTKIVLVFVAVARMAVIAANTPLGRIAEPVDVANAVVFLASDLARHITGASLVIDGGSTIRYSQPAGN